MQPAAGAITVTVVGTLVDTYSGRPIANRIIEVDQHKATTDNDGHFRIEGVISRTPVLLKFGDIATGKDPVKPSTFTGVIVDFSKAAGGVLDIGTKEVRDFRTASEAFGSVCTGAKATEEPKVPFLYLVKYGKKWILDGSERLSWQAPWKAVLCVERTYKVVGQYGSGGAPATELTLRVDAIRISDGAVFKTKIVAEPPKRGSTLGGELGNATEQLNEWLKNLR